MDFLPPGQRRDRMIWVTKKLRDNRLQPPALLLVESSRARTHNLTIMFSESGIGPKTRRMINLLLGAAYLIIAAADMNVKRPSLMPGIRPIVGVSCLVLAAVYFYRAWHPREMDSPENLSLRRPPSQ